VDHSYGSSSLLLIIIPHVAARVPHLFPGNFHNPLASLVPGYHNQYSIIQGEIFTDFQLGLPPGCYTIISRPPVAFLFLPPSCLHVLGTSTRTWCSIYLCIFSSQQMSPYQNHNCCCMLHIFPICCWIFWWLNPKCVISYVYSLYNPEIAIVGCFKS